MQKLEALNHIMEERAGSKDFGRWAPQELGEKEASRMTPKFPAWAPGRKTSLFARTGSHAGGTVKKYPLLSSTSLVALGVLFPNDPSLELAVSNLRPRVKQIQFSIPGPSRTITNVRQMNERTEGLAALPLYFVLQQVKISSRSRSRKLCGGEGCVCAGAQTDMSLCKIRSQSSLEKPVSCPQDIPCFEICRVQ